MTGQGPPERIVTLFEEVMALDFSESEKARISRALADRNSLQAKVLADNGPSIRDNEFWGRGQKKFNIKGFRVGHPEAIKRVIARSFAAARSYELGAPNQDWPLIWPLYERSVRIYLQDEMPELTELLKKEEFKAGSGAVTDQILRRIVSCLPLHQATLDQVREFYDLWGFERTESIDEILSRAPLEADAARRMIDESVRSARKEILASLSSAKADFQRQIDQYGVGLESVKSTLKGLQHDLRDRPSKSSADVALQPKREVVTLPAKTPTASSSPNLNQAALATIESLRSRVESLGRQLKELRGHVEGSQERREEHIDSARSAASRAPFLTTQQVIERWRDALSDSGLPNSTAAGRVMWELVRRSRIVLATKPTWMVTLFTSITSGQCRSRAVSPLWLSDADWKEECAFITEVAEQPRLLVLEDFDVALQDAYLVPGLVTWLSTLRANCANRIVLVPASGDLEAISPRILEIATYAAHGAPHIQNLSMLDNSAMPPLQEAPQATVQLLGFSRDTDVDSEVQLRRYAANLGIVLAPRVAESFVSLDQGLRPLLGRRTARMVAQEATLIPWTACARGAAVEKILREALQVLNAE